MICKEYHELMKESLRIRSNANRAAMRALPLDAAICWKHNGYLQTGRILRVIKATHNAHFRLVVRNDHTKKHVTVSITQITRVTKPEEKEGEE